MATKMCLPSCKWSRCVLSFAGTWANYSKNTERQISQNFQDVLRLSACCMCLRIFCVCVLRLSASCVCLRVVCVGVCLRLACVCVSAFSVVVMFSYVSFWVRFLKNNFLHGQDALKNKPMHSMCTTNFFKNTFTNGQGKPSRVTRIQHRDFQLSAAGTVFTACILGFVAFRTIRPRGFLILPEAMLFRGCQAFFAGVGKLITIRAFLIVVIPNTMRPMVLHGLQA